MEILFHQTLAWGLKISSVVTIEVSAKTTGTSMDQLGSNNFNPKSISDDLKHTKANSVKMQKVIVFYQQTLVLNVCLVD